MLRSGQKRKNFITYLPCFTYVPFVEVSLKTDDVMKILYLLVKAFSEVTVLLESWVHTMFVHAHSSEASHVVVFLWEVLKSMFCFVCFFPYLSSFNIHMYIPSHKVQNPGLVKAVVPLNRYFILLYFLTNKRSVHCDQVWQIQETGTQWCACLYTMNIDHVNWFHMVPPKIRICKSSWLM